MKRTAAFLIGLVLLISMTACLNDEKISGIASTSAATQAQSSTQTESKFRQFEEGLTVIGINYFKSQKDMASVGAQEGYCYYFDDGTAVELYSFDKKSDVYINVKKTNQITDTATGTLIKAALNNEMVMCYIGTPADKNLISNIFSNLK